MEKTCQDCKYYKKTRDGFAMYCTKYNQQRPDIDKKNCAHFTPKPKENKMKIGIFKFSFRRYVMLCTIAFTTKMAIWLNPVVFWLASLVRSDWSSKESIYFEETGRGVLGSITVPWDSGDWKQIIVVWSCAIMICNAIYIVIYAFNKFTAWIFGERK